MPTEGQESSAAHDDAAVCKVMAPVAHTIDTGDVDACVRCITADPRWDLRDAPRVARPDVVASFIDTAKPTGYRPPR
jgi:hypothetical protein